MSTQPTEPLPAADPLESLRAAFEADWQHYHSDRRDRAAPWFQQMLATVRALKAVKSRDPKDPVFQMRELALYKKAEWLKFVWYERFRIKNFLDQLSLRRNRIPDTELQQSLQALDVEFARLEADWRR